MSTIDEVRGSDNSRNMTAQRIRKALRQRSGKTWSVWCGRGTAWGWIHIAEKSNESMTPEKCAELAKLLGLDVVHCQGESIPASSDYYAEYIDRAEGRAPSVIGKHYWD